MYQRSRLTVATFRSLSFSTTLFTNRPGEQASVIEALTGVVMRGAVAVPVALESPSLPR